MGVTINASFARIPAKAARAKLSITDFKVLIAIGLHADKDGKAFPSMGRLATIAGIRRNHVPRSLVQLEKQGLLHRERVPRPTGGWQASRYQLVYEPIGDVISTENTTTGDVTPSGDTIAEMSPAEVTGCHQPREQGVTPVGALTNHRTDQGTVLSQVSGVGGYREVDGPVTNPGDTGPVLNSEDTLCDWYITNDHGYRICRKPTSGARYCPEHAAAATW